MTLPTAQIFPGRVSRCPSACLESGLSDCRRRAPASILRRNPKSVALLSGGGLIVMRQGWLAASCRVLALRAGLSASSPRGAASIRLGMFLAAVCAAPAARALPTTYRETGKASWYGAEFAGKSTACGEAFDPTALTAAHATLPFGTRVRITNLDNGRSTVVRINDRGPFVPGVIVDCSQEAANVLGFMRQGVARVAITSPERGGESEPEDTSPGAVRTRAGAPSGSDTVSTRRPARRARAHATRQASVSAAASGGSRGGAPDSGVAAQGATAGAAPAARSAPEDPAPPAPGGGPSYCVQIGAYRDPTHADAQLRKATRLSLPAFVQRTRRLCHVLVGPFTDRARAAETRAQLSRAGVRGYVRPFVR